MKNKDENIGYWLAKFVMTSLCFFLFSTINADIQNQNQGNDGVHSAISYLVKKTQQAAILTVPVRTPDYSAGYLSLSHDYKLPDCNYFYSSWHRAKESENRLQLCYNTYLQIKQPIRAFLLIKPGSLSTDDTDPSVS